MKKKSGNQTAYAANKGVDSEKFLFSEAFKTVRTNLMFTLSTSQNKVIVVSSAEPSSGKSTTCAHLAQAMAQTNSRVLIVDADMRKPTQHRFFRVNNGNGLSRLLSRNTSIGDCIHRDVSPSLDLISSGPIPPNPSELLGSSNLDGLLSELSESYDYIFIDSPPVCVVADPLLIAHKTAGVVLIARQKQTTYENLQKAVESLQTAQSNILGVIVTDVQDRHKPYSYYRKEGYYAYSSEK